MSDNCACPDPYVRTAVQLVAYVDAGAQRAYITPNDTMVVSSGDNASSLVMTPSASGSAIHVAMRLLPGNPASTPCKITVYAIPAPASSFVLGVDQMFSLRETGTCLFDRTATNLDESNEQMELAFIMLKSFNVQSICVKPPTA